MKISINTSVKINPVLKDESKTLSEEIRKYKNLIDQAVFEAKLALKAKLLLDNENNPSLKQRNNGFSYDDDLRRLLMRSFLIHASTCSRIIFPDKKDQIKIDKNGKVNGRNLGIAKKLQNKLRLSKNTSYIARRDVRDACEHIDERIERWAEKSSFNKPFHNNIVNGIQIDYSQIEGEVITNYINGSIISQDKNGKIIILDIPRIEKELKQIISS